MSFVASAVSSGSVSRRRVIRWMSAVPAAALLGRVPAVWADQPAAQDPVEEPLRNPGFTTANIRTTDLGKGLTMISRPGGNITVLAAGENSLVVDTGIGPRSGDVVKAVTAAAGGKTPATLINTHYHFDHTGGNVALAAAGAVTRIAHEKTQRHLSETMHVAFLNLDFPPLDPAGRPTQTFADTLEKNGAKLSHFDPAHTDGDVAIHFPEANVLATGDLFFNGAYPFIDYGVGGSLAGAIAAAERLLKMAD